MNAKTPWYSNIWIFILATTFCWPVALYMIIKYIGNHPAQAYNAPRGDDTKTPWYSNIWIFILASAFCCPLALYMAFRSAADEPCNMDDEKAEKKRVLAAAAYSALD